MFDTLKYVNILESKGFTREQAETQVSLVRDVMSENFATKSDVSQLKMDLNNFRDNVDHKLEKLEMRLTIKLGSIMVIMSTLIVTLQKIL